LKFARAIQRKYDVSGVCVTRAEEGCLLVDGDRVADVPGIAVQVADAVGAGDAFNAALTLARLRGLDTSDAARFSNEVGGLVASCPGGMPELGDALGELMRRYGLDAVRSRGGEQ
jgi:sugar/nucleoside kinase (ribokinase family)